MGRLFADRETRLLLVGQSLSTYGDLAMFLALGIWAKELTGSNAAAGLVFFAYVVPTLAAPLAGVVVDRFPRRPLMIGVDCAIGVILLALLFVNDAGDIWLLYTVTVLYGCAALLINAAQPALMKVMVADELLGEANAAFQTVRQGLRLLAPLTGAGLFAAVGGPAVAVIDAATFAVAALALAALRTVEPEPEPHEQHFVAGHGATAAAPSDDCGATAARSLRRVAIGAPTSSQAARRPVSGTGGRCDRRRFR